MSAHEKALEKAKKHSHKKGKDGKCEVCDKVMNLVKGDEGEVDDKGKLPRREFGAKNNDSQED